MALRLLDTTDQPVADSAERLEQWVAERGAARGSGRLELLGGWTEDTPVSADRDA